MGIKRFISKARDAKISDYLSFFPMLIGCIASPFYKKKYKNVWGICERKTEARDNGYHFFRYMTREHPEQRCIYAIDRKCNDFKKVSGLGETVQFGSVKHWIMYFTCKYLISSQAFKPNAYVCTFIERARLFKPNHIFLQHGVIINTNEFLRVNMRRVKLFVTSTPQERDFVATELGHGFDVVKMCGLARFDALHDPKPDGNRIFIMPTWRKWLRFRSEAHEDAQMDIGSSEYLTMWKGFLNSPKLRELAEMHNLDFVFYPHPNMRGILKPENIIPSYITIADLETADIQELIKSSKLLITDYSSVFFDMVYMKRPVIFYQFDLDKFRKYHYAKGWFDYQTTSFGKSVKDPEGVVEEISRLADSGFCVDSAFEEEHARTFPLYDSKNSERVYKLLFDQTIDAKLP